MSPNRCATVALLALLVGSLASPTAAAGLRLIGADFRVGRL